MEITKFMEKLASDGPTPGGGSASAFAGALSASLVAMVAGLSVNKGRLTKKEAKDIRRKALTIQRRLHRAIAEDAKSFDSVMATFRLPKRTEKERLHRAKMIQRAYRKATVIPERVCKSSAELLEFCRILAAKGNPNAWSDIGVAAYLANAALQGGTLNVKINLVSIRDRSFGDKKLQWIRRLSRKRERLISQIQKSLPELVK